MKTLAELQSELMEFTVAKREKKTAQETTHEEVAKNGGIQKT